MIVELSSCTIDLSARRGAHTDGREVQLTTREADLLAYLTEHPREDLDRSQLLTDVWGYCDTVLSRACDSTVVRLRSKIERDPQRPVHLITVHGVGYRFVPPPGPTAPLAPASPAPARHITLWDRRVDLDAQVIIGPEGRTPLTPNEVALLTELHDAAGAIRDRRALQRKIWGRTSGRSIDHAVSRLRHKIEANPADPMHLLTHRGQGYRLVLTVAAPDDDDLVGRSQDLRALDAALAASRWVLIVGPGGIGKTRLAQRQSNGLWVDAITATDRAELCRITGRLLGLTSRAATAPGIGRALADRDARLLVLDNLEQCADHIGDLLEIWLDLAPALRILGTSRVRLGLDRERVLELGPLDRASGTLLFERRARATSHRFTADAADRERIGDLVEALDGLPLALELAAARAPVLGPQGLLDRLDRRLDLLARPRAQDTRHRSLRHTIEASLQMLNPTQLDLLATLGHFVHGFSVEDVEALVGNDGVDLLQELRDHCLVQDRPGDLGHPFQILESVRQALADERRSRPDQGASLALAWIRPLARMAEPWDDAGGREPFFRAADDLMAAALLAEAWGWAEEAALCLIHRTQGAANTGVPDRLPLAVARLKDHPDLPQRTARWLAYSDGILRMGAERMEEAKHVLSTTLSAAAGEDPWCAGLSALNLAIVHHDLHDPERAGARFTDAAQHFQDAGRPDREASAAAQAAMALGQIDEALHHIDHALALVDPTTNPVFASLMLMTRGHIALRRGRLIAAREDLSEAVRLSRESGIPGPLVGRALNLVPVLLQLGDHAALDEIFPVCIDAAKRTGRPFAVGVTHLYRATALQIRGDLDAAEVAIHEARTALSRTSRLIWRGEAAVDAVEAEVHLQRRSVPRALALAQRAHEAHLEHADAESLPQSGALLARCLAASGDLDAGWAAANAAVDRAADRPASLALALLARGLVALASGDRAAARLDLDRASDVAADVDRAGTEVRRLRDELFAGIGSDPGPPEDP